MRTCNDWWLSTKTNPKIFKRPDYQTEEIENYLLMCPTEVDPKTIGAEINRTPSQVTAIQRRLGIRKCAVSNPRASGRFPLDMRGRYRKGKGSVDRSARSTDQPEGPSL